MIDFDELEKSAILQCFWQLLRANPSQEENDFINKMTSSWELGRGGWMYNAIQQDTNIAFNCIRNMHEEKKEKFKKLVISIVEYKGDNDYKTKLAATLFDKTNIPYAISARSTLVYNENNNGMYQIL